MISYEDLSDIELFIKTEKYDPYALEELYIRYSPVLYPLISRIVNNHKETEDILIDVFISVWRKIDLFNFESGNTYTWLITLARNRAVAAVRKKHSEQIDASMDEEQYDDFYIMPDLDNKIEPMDFSSAMKKKYSVEEAINKLTEAQKYVLYLSYYDGFTVNDIAEKLNIPLTTIRSKIMISLHTLKDQLSGTSSNSAENNDLKEMIAAYAVGCMDNENYSYFKKYKIDGDYLPAGELGKLQTIISLLSISLSSTNIADDLKERLGFKLLDTHKKILNKTLPNRRITKSIEASPAEIPKPNVTVIDLEIEEEPPVEQKDETFEPVTNISAPQEEEIIQSSRSKLFWIFNFILLAGLIIFSYLLSDETSQLNDKVESMKMQLTEINSETSAAKDFITEHMDFVDFFNNPDILIITLSGEKESPNSHGRFFLSMSAGEGLLELKKMPRSRTDQYFTLWMIGKKANILLGSFKIIPEEKFIKISQIPNGTNDRISKFIITQETMVEPDKPSEKIYLSGKIIDP